MYTMLIVFFFFTPTKDGEKLIAPQPIVIGHYSSEEECLHELPKLGTLRRGLTSFITSNATCIKEN